MKNLGAAISGGNGARRDDDFYPTPYEATEALLLSAGKYLGRVVHEPACGDGAMAQVLETYGHNVIATDLIHRGYGEGGVDFLKSKPRASDIVTNPPFNLAAKFIEHAAGFQPDFFALLLKSTFWNAAKRLPLFRMYPPKLIMPLTWRLDFTGGGAPTMDCTWFVWGNNVAECAYLPLPKPVGELMSMVA